MKLGFCGQILEKSSDIKFNQILASGSWVVPCGRMDEPTDRRDEANSRLSQFWEHA